MSIAEFSQKAITVQNKQRSGINDGGRRLRLETMDALGVVLIGLSIMSAASTCELTGKHLCCSLLPSISCVPAYRDEKMRRFSLVIRPR